MKKQFYLQWIPWWYGNLMQTVLLWTKQRCWRKFFGTSRRNLIQPLGFFGRKRSSLIPRIQLQCLIMRRSWRQLGRSKPFLFFNILIVSPEVFHYFAFFFVFCEHLVWCWWVFHRAELYALFVLNLVHLHFNDLWCIYWNMLYFPGLACYRNHKGSSILLKKKQKIFQMLEHIYCSCRK